MINGDYKEEFLQHINGNTGIIHRVCNIYFNCSPEREDVFQEILYQLWKSYPAFKGNSKFSTWMYRIALNTAITHIKKKDRIPRREELNETYHQLPESIGEDHKEMNMRLLYTAIDTLSPIDKAIILLYLEDYSYEEIALITGLTKTNTSVRLVRIKRKLEEQLRNSI